MTHNIMRAPRAALLRMASAALLLAAAPACNEFLTATNPGAVEEPDVNVPSNVDILTYGAISTYQFSHSEITYWNAQLTDELFNRAVFAEEGEIDRRNLFSDMTYINAFMYGPAQRARYAADDASKRLKEILGDTASRDLRLARALAYSGHNYVDLGEMMCVTPIDLSVPKSSEEMFADAITRFQEAISVATAAKSYLQSRTPVNAAAVAGADSVRYFALVGAARAALNRDDKAAAIGFANQVPATFEFRAYYTDNTTGQRNRTYERLQLASNAYLLNTPFAAMTTDPRVPRIAGTTARAFTPLSPPSYSTFTNTLAGGTFAAVMSVRVASGLEAQYVVAEAQGPTAATLAFVNARRAVGQQTPVTLTGDALMAELRDQRSRDFYLDNHRLGDLRRYLKYYKVDLFPTGAYPGSTSGQTYNAAISCWPLPTNEITGNPNIPK
jgi:starch-binding outer membrane protein, SusD/RagB family